jgi:AraC-like DNA-binding protein/mannose-6-phosphate isomerase-like protein (cupin superfamily)
MVAMSGMIAAGTIETCLADRKTCTDMTGMAAVIPIYPWHGDADRVAASRMTFGAPRCDPGFPPHRHGYAEAFWIERGRCRHRANGGERMLAPGDLTFIRADDLHSGAGVDRNGFTLVNVMLAAGAPEELRRRYGIAAAAWPWWDGPEPRTYHLAPEQVRVLRELTERLRPDGQGAFARDALVLAVVQAALSADEEHRAADAPAWLVAALRREDALRGGVPALAHACGCGPAHLNRTVRRHFGTTASDLINRLRLDRAARLLRLGDAPVAQVATACGFANLAWFHRAFRSRFATSPRRYRVAAWRPISTA